MRNKWNEMHGINTYGDMTITKAIDDCNNTFEPSQTRDFNGINTVETPSKPCQNESENTQNQQENEQNGQENEQNPHFLDRFHKFNAKGNITGVFDAEIVDYIIKNNHIVSIGDIVYLYEEGIYKEDRKGKKLKFIIQNLIYKEFQNSRTINRIYELVNTAFY